MQKKKIISAILVLAILGIQNCFGSCYALPSPDSSEERVFAQDVCGGVDNNPPNPTIFTIDSPRTITKIGTYHWNSGQGTQTPGTIGLMGPNWKIYGPWQASGQPGPGGVLNAYWIVTLTTGLNLPAGKYTVLDSDPSTWAYNSESDNSGVVSIVGLNVGGTKVTQAPCGEEAMDLSMASPTDQYRAGPMLTPGSYKIWYGKRTGTQIGQPDNWDTKPVELLEGKFYVFDVSTGDFSSANPQMINPMLSNPTPGESVVWYKASTQYAYVVCFEGPLNPSQNQADKGVPGSLLEAVSVSSGGTPVYTTHNLEAGKYYVIQASGIFSYWDDSTGGADAYFDYRDQGVELRPLQIDDQSMYDIARKKGDPIEYSPNHFYETSIDGQGRPLKFWILDTGPYSDNHGSLEVKVYGRQSAPDEQAT